MTRTLRAKPTRPSPAPAALGLTVLANLQKGRARLQAINADRKAQGEFIRRMVAEFAMLDAAAGHPHRGRAKRIAHKLKGRRSERRIRKILVSLVPLVGGTARRR